VTTEGRVATLSPWFCGTAPASDAPWLLDASAKLLARLHKSALCIPVCYPRPDRPTYHGLNWAKNYLFELDVVRSLLYTDPSPLYKTCRAEDLKVIDEILKHRAFIMEQHCVWSKQVRKLHRTRPNLIRAPIHGDIYAANMLCNGERIVAVIDWDECQYEPLVYELGRVLWELAKDGQTHSLDEIKMASFLSEYRRNGGPVPDEELDLLVFYIGMLRIIEILLYLNNSTKGDYWSARYTLDNLRALEQLEMPF
jgi:Ser/Thr protein kinase RdoA (MazF antagonist)